eukprot:SAG11_NODE_489_length_8994_cov_8.385904_6_plen_211_part_00
MKVARRSRDEPILGWWCQLVHILMLAAVCVPNDCKIQQLSRVVGNSTPWMGLLHRFPTDRPHQYSSEVFMHITSGDTFTPLRKLELNAIRRRAVAARKCAAETSYQPEPPPFHFAWGRASARADGVIDAHGRATDGASTRIDAAHWRHTTLPIPPAPPHSSATFAWVPCAARRNHAAVPVAAAASLRRLTRLSTPRQPAALEDKDTKSFR